jgi:polar amino acid transport system substrate-binding protein
MKRKLKNAFVASLTLLAILKSLTMAVMAAETPSELRVGVAPISPPMIFREGGKVVGLEADFAQALGVNLGRQVKFVELRWEDIIDALVNDKIDIIMSSMSVTRARQARIAFSNPYMRIGQMMLIRTEEQGRYGLLLDSLGDKSIGVRKGTTGDVLVQQEFSRAKRKYYRSGDDAAAALRKGRIDLFIDDSSMIWYLAGSYEAKGLTASPMVLSDEVLAWGMRMSDASLQQSVNAFLKRTQDSGEATRLVRQWIPKFH